MNQSEKQFETPATPSDIGPLVAKSFELFTLIWSKLFPITMAISVIIHIPYLIQLYWKEHNYKSIPMTMLLGSVEQILSGIVYAVLFHQTLALMHSKQCDFKQSMFVVKNKIGSILGVQLILLLLSLAWEIALLGLISLDKTPIVIFLSLSVLIAGGLVLYAGVRLVLMLPLIVLEDKTILGALAHSWYTTKGYFWRIIGIMIIPLLFIPLALFVIVIAAYALHVLGGIMASTFIVAMLITLKGAFFMMLYNDLRLRRQVG